MTTSATSRVGRPLDVWFLLWVLFSVAMLVTVEVVPGSECVPFHLALAVFALAYSRRLWSVRASVLSLTFFYLVIAALFVRDSLNDDLQWGEVMEVPITAFLVAGVMWHVTRAQMALDLVSAAADRDRAVARDRERLARLTSHELRTPLTVVRGFIDLSEEADVPLEVRGHLVAAREELDDLNRVVDRMVRAAHMNRRLPREEVHIPSLLNAAAARWRAVASRRWVVDAGDVTVLASRERLVASVDTLVENALRYTAPGDVVRLVGQVEDGWLLLGVADGGRGIPEPLRRRLDERHRIAGDVGPDATGDGPWEDPDAGSGLGLEIVRRAAHMRGGIVVAGTSPEGGALVAMWTPASPVEDGIGAQGLGLEPPAAVRSPEALLARPLVPLVDGGLTAQSRP